jgi:hypothetical protein
VKIVDVEDVGKPGGKVSPVVKVTRHGGRPVRHAHVRFAGYGSFTNRRGQGQVFARIDTPGWFKVFARKGDRYGTSRLVNVGVQQSSAPATRPSAR